MIFLAHLVSLHTRRWQKNFKILWTLISDLVLEKKADKHTQHHKPNKQTKKQTTSKMFPIWGFCYSFFVHLLGECGMSSATDTGDGGLRRRASGAGAYTLLTPSRSL